MEDILERGWIDLVRRLDGPMHFRFIVQPTVATLLAIRAGIRDAREGRPPFLWSLLRHPEHRRDSLRRAWKDTRNVFLVAIALDTIYQLRVHAGVYALELLTTAVLLALVPYALVHGLATRIAGMKHRTPVPPRRPGTESS